MEKIRTKSTSRSSAECSDLVLRETNTTRLVFRPILVDNPSNSEAAVNGTFIFQRKGQRDNWTDTETIPLSQLKKDEGYKLEIKSSELLSLFNHLSDLYQLHSQSGVPRGDVEFVPVNRQLADIARMPPGDLLQILAANRAVGSKLLARLLAWAADSDDPAALVGRLIELSPASLRTLNIAVNLQTLRAALTLWEENKTSSDEEFWQTSLTENSFVLEHVFSWPTMIVKGKAYVGGKSVMNTGGNVIDFLMKNLVTRNAALIEIKTPAAPLLSREYRSGIYTPSNDLLGSVMQVLNYKHSLQQEYHSLTRGQGDLFDSFDPRCAVILGNARRELEADDKRKSFELFRGQFPSVDIITFDELFSRAEQLLRVLESPRTQPELPDNGVPF